MGLFSKIKAGLQKTRNSIAQNVNSIINSFTKIDEEFFEELEEILVMSDIGVATSNHYYFLIHTHRYIIRLYILRQNILPSYVTKGWGKCSGILLLFTFPTPSVRLLLFFR